MDLKVKQDFCLAIQCQYGKRRRKHDSVAFSGVVICQRDFRFEAVTL